MVEFEQAVPIDPMDTLKVLLYALVAASLSELGSYIMVYRKDQYKSLKQNIDSTNQKIKKTKNTQPSPDQQKSYKKKLAQLENTLKNYNQEMSSFRMKSTFIIALFMIITVNSFGTMFQGIVMAKLPFHPFSLFQGITHRGLMGDDYTDCSYLFLYILSAYVVRTNIQKIFGFEAPKSMNPFAQLAQQQEQQ
ncbi:hypothetical protein PPERSA_06720 [Pseudocohnilembus persalinus]|uniref:Calcium load-activated calcium channel n=1 Tax=Pseudocohnilembus persalinus TaxID=266149 RepID=A0A0V0QRY2_PSEPJ|nr:hypothetical protein PPERSA_06720 [Pseudocohnilembus persalinus]|eukprot:KRX05086.1 hypothetical protein PPERSA_06720 [Pseudocohnilembus persalinus]